MSIPSTGISLISEFRKLFGEVPTESVRIFRAPGRVNLIGEHTDYNDGFVMPIAIGAYTWIAAAPRADRVLEVYSDHFDEKIALPLDALSGAPRKHWSDYIRGVAARLLNAGHRLCGASFVIRGDVPLGAGLSSSASLEMCAAQALTSIAGIVVPRLELVKLCQAAEHEYVGTHCGIMDQFAAGFATAGRAMMLDCRSLEYELLAIPPDITVVICNSMARHELASGEYNLRRADCEAGVRILQELLPDVRALRDVGIDDLERYKHRLIEKLYRRCHHVVTENERVLAAAKALRGQDAARFGELMYQSHASLRDDYEVSCKELDLLVDLASSMPGVHGARMTGGGFGGCTVNLLRSDFAAAFQSDMKRMYAERTGIVPEIYSCEPSAAAEEWATEGSVQS